MRGKCFVQEVIVLWGNTTDRVVVFLNLQHIRGCL
jgi:hypothetical protein